MAISIGRAASLTREGGDVMRWVLGTSLRFGRLVIALAIGLMVIGTTQLRSAPTDVYPEFMPPSVEVQTEALGLSAAEVEQLITVPLEQDLLNGVPWLDRIHSSSRPGLSAIDLTFQRGTDIYAARQMVQERLTQAHALPNVGSPPIMIQPPGVDEPGRHDRIVLTQRVADRHVRARPLEAQAPAHGCARCGERVRLRPARPAAAGSGRPEASAGQGRVAHPGNRYRRQRAVGVAR